MQLDFERAVISTFLFADMNESESIIRDIELREEWFTDFNHKLIVHAINSLKVTGFYDELTVRDYLLNDRRFNYGSLESCIASTPAGSITTLNAWIDKVKSSVKNLHEAV